MQGSSSSSQQNAIVDTCFFVCLLSECSLHVAQNTMSRVLPSGIPAGIPDSVGFRNELILPWNDLIPMCVPWNSAESAELRRFRKMRPVRNQNTKRNAHPRVGIVQVIRQTTTQFPPQTSSPWCSVCPPHGVDSWVAIHRGCPRALWWDFIYISKISEKLI